MNVKKEEKKEEEDEEKMMNDIGVGVGVGLFVPLVFGFFRSTKYLFKNNSINRFNLFLKNYNKTKEKLIAI